MVVLRNGKRTGCDVIETVPISSHLYESSTEEEEDASERESGENSESTESSDLSITSIVDPEASSRQVEFVVPDLSMNRAVEETELVGLEEGAPNEEVVFVQRPVMRRSSSCNRRGQRSRACLNFLTRILLVLVLTLIAGGIVVALAKLFLLMDEVRVVIGSEHIRESTTGNAGHEFEGSLGELSTTSLPTSSTISSTDGFWFGPHQAVDLSGPMFRFSFSDVLCRPSVSSMICTSSILRSCIVRRFGQEAVDVLSAVPVSIDIIRRIIESDNEAFSVCDDANWYISLN